MNLFSKANVSTYRAAQFLQMMLLSTAALSLAGCFGSFLEPRSYDVTSGAAWWGELHLNEVLELNQDTLLSGHALELSTRKVTSTLGTEKLFGGPITVEMFKANPGKYWEDLHLLPKGTKLRCVKLERWLSSEGKDYLISAIILDGEFKGTIAYVIPWGDPDKKGSLQLGPYSLVHPAEQ